MGAFFDPILEHLTEEAEEVKLIKNDGRFDISHFFAFGHSGCYDGFTLCYSEDGSWENRIFLSDIDIMFYFRENISEEEREKQLQKTLQKEQKSLDWLFGYLDRINRNKGVAQ